MLPNMVMFVPKLDQNALCLAISEKVYDIEMFLKRFCAQTATFVTLFVNFDSKWIVKLWTNIIWRNETHFHSDSSD